MKSNLIRLVAAAGLAAAFVPAQHEEEEIIIKAIEAKQKAESKHKARPDGGKKLHAALMEAIEKLSDDDLSSGQRKQAKQHLLEVVAKLKAHVRAQGGGESVTHDVFVVGEDDGKAKGGWVFKGDGGKGEGHGVFVVGEDGLPHHRVWAKKDFDKKMRKMVFYDQDGKPVPHGWVEKRDAKDYDTWVEVKKKAGDNWLELKGKGKSKSKGKNKSKKGGLHFLRDGDGAFVVTEQSPKGIARVKGLDLAEVRSHLDEHHDVIVEHHKEIAEHQKKIEEMHAKIAGKERDLASRASELRARIRKADGGDAGGVFFLEKGDGEKARVRFEKASESYERARRALERAEHRFGSKQGKADEKSKGRKFWVEYSGSDEHGDKAGKKGAVHLFRKAEKPAKTRLFGWSTKAKPEEHEHEEHEHGFEFHEHEVHEHEAHEHEEIREMIEDVRSEMRALREMVRDIRNELRRGSRAPETRRGTPARVRGRRMSAVSPVGPRRSRDTR